MASAYLYKMIIIGDSGAGKSNLMSQYICNEFFDSPSTIGVEFMTKDIIYDKKNIKIQIWDTAGQEKFRAISRCIYHGSKGAILVYDITNQNSFENISHWLKEFRSQVPECTKLLLIGNKCDLHDLRQVQTNHAIEFSKDNHLLFLETSALSSHNVDKAFELLIDEICKENIGRSIVNYPKPKLQIGEKIQLPLNKDNEIKKKKCCV